MRKRGAMQDGNIWWALTGAIFVAACVARNAPPARTATAPSVASAQPAASAQAATVTAASAQPPTAPSPSAQPAASPVASAQPAAMPVGSAHSFVSPAVPDMDQDTGAHAKYSSSLGEGSRSAMAPKGSIPSPPVTIEVSPNASVDTAVRSVPGQVPMGGLSRSVLESPIKNAQLVERCKIPPATRVEIGVAIYNGQAIGVDVKSNPTSRSVDFCVERAVRQSTWVKELAINRVKVTL